MTVTIARVYSDPTPHDGLRVLVDRLWPRGIAKARAAIDEWPKDITPSTELRKRYHDGMASAEFQREFEAELTAPAARAEIDRLRAIASTSTVTLVTAVRNPDSSHASILRDLITAPCD